MLVVIITGGIASGKSFILRYLKKLSYNVFETDCIAKGLMQSEDFLKKIKIQPGYTVKQKIESDPQFLDEIETIIHPEIYKYRDKWLQTMILDQKMVFIEIPLFFEKNLRSILKEKYTILVIATITGIYKQKIRAQKRDLTLSDKLIEIILKKQCNDEQRVAESDFIVYTYQSKLQVKKQVKNILNILKYECINRNSTRFRNNWTQSNKGS